MPRSESVSISTKLSTACLHSVLYSSLRLTPENTSKLDEVDLLASFPASRSTVRGALGLLADEGFVDRAPSRGTRPSGRLITLPSTTEVEDATLEVHQHADYRLKESPVTMATLGEGEISVLEALVSVEGRPLLLHATLFRESLVTAYEVESVIEAETAHEASAAILGVPVGAGLLVKTSFAFDAAGKPLRIDISWFVGHRVALHAVNQLHHHTVDLVDKTRAKSTARQRRGIGYLYRELRLAVRLGLLAPGQTIDSQEIGRQYDASRTTVRGALDKLVDEGIISRARRRGTQVVLPIKEYSLLPQHQFDYSVRAPGNRLEELLSARIQAPDALARTLGSVDGTVDVIEYVHWFEALPVSYIRYLMPTDNPRPPMQDDVKNTFEELFERHYGVSAGQHEIFISLVRADDRVADNMRVRKGSLLLLKETLVMGADGQPREYTHMSFPAPTSAMILPRSQPDSLSDADVLSAW